MVQQLLQTWAALLLLYAALPTATQQARLSFLLPPGCHETPLEAFSIAAGRAADQDTQLLVQLPASCLLLSHLLVVSARQCCLLLSYSILIITEPGLDMQRDESKTPALSGAGAIMGNHRLAMQDSKSKMSTLENCIHLQGEIIDAAELQNPSMFVTCLNPNMRLAAAGSFLNTLHSIINHAMYSNHQGCCPCTTPCHCSCCTAKPSHAAADAHPRSITAAAHLTQSVS
jgi:hypothetical protein